MAAANSSVDRQILHQLHVQEMPATPDPPLIRRMMSLAVAARALRPSG
jgi:hypothetical protein